MCWLKRKSVSLLFKRTNTSRSVVSDNLIEKKVKLKSFQHIPGPISLPLIGTVYQYLPLVGRYRFDKLHLNGLQKFKTFGPIVREEIIPGVNIVWIFRPEDYETLFRNEGKYPKRRSHLALEKYRLDRPNVYNTGGLLPTNGPEWRKLRKIFQKGLSSPTDVLNQLECCDDVVQEWIDIRIREVLTKNNNVDYLPELSRLFLELMGIATLDVRFGSFSNEELNSNSRTSQLIKSAFITNSTILKTDAGPHLWKKFETPLYKKLKKAQEFMESVAIDVINYKLRIFKDSNPNDRLTLLESYLACPKLDMKDVIGIVCDFLLAGIDTTTYTTSFLLYHLAVEQKIQQTLYEETLKLLPKPDSSVTNEVLNGAVFAKAFLKETLRLRPVSVGVGRILTEDVNFSGYKVPQETVIVTQNQISCRLDEYFPQANKFIPERWLKSLPSYKAPHPFLVLPFGFGARSCIARRLAEQNMLIVLLKLTRNYHINWNGSDLDIKTLLINKPDGPILLTLQKR